MFFYVLRVLSKIKEKWEPNRQCFPYSSYFSEQKLVFKKCNKACTKYVFPYVSFRTWKIIKKEKKIKEIFYFFLCLVS